MQRSRLKVEVRLFATLRKYLPAGSGRVSAQVEMAAGASIGDVLEKLGIPAAGVHLVLVNGQYEGDRKRALTDGCALSIWPPIAGG